MSKKSDKVIIRDGPHGPWGGVRHRKDRLKGLLSEYDLIQWNLWKPTTAGAKEIRRVSEVPVLGGYEKTCIGSNLSSFEYL